MDPHRVGNDAAGRLVDLLGPTVDGEPAMSATHFYDSRGRLAEIDEAALGAFLFEYDAAGRREALIRPNGANTTTAYDAAGRTTATTTLDALVHEITTTWDARGLPDAQTDQEGTHDYAHDVRGRLVGVDHPDGAAFADEAYTYDKADRRTSGGAVYDDGDRLVQDADYAYGYDAEGRRTSRTHRVTGEVTTYTYDALDHLVRLEERGAVWTFAYDALDLRVRVASGSYDARFVYDLNGTVRARYDASGALTAAYLAGFGFGDVLARVDGAAEYAVRDRLGTTVGWLDDAGSVAELTVRDAYGVRDAPEAVVPFGYTGHAEDPTGLAWGRARHLEPKRGVWVSEDPTWTEPRYCYGGGAPAILKDVDGRVSLFEYFEQHPCPAFVIAGVSSAVFGYAALKSEDTILSGVLGAASWGSGLASVGALGLCFGGGGGGVGRTGPTGMTGTYK